MLGFSLIQNLKFQLHCKRIPANMSCMKKEDYSAYDILTQRKRKKEKEEISVLNICLCKLALQTNACKVPPVKIKIGRRIITGLVHGTLLLCPITSLKSPTHIHLPRGIFCSVVRQHVPV